MLHQFTWQQFLIAALILTLVWYLVIILLFYRRKVTGLLSGKTKLKQPEKLRREWEEELEDGFEEEDLMGKPSEPEGVSTLPMEALRFADKDAGKDEQLGLVPDVLEELKSIFDILTKEDGSKSDFFSLLKLVKAKYPGIGSSPNIGRINAHIREHVPFLLTEEELENLWD